jgi:hypothetical protein
MDAIAKAVGSFDSEAVQRDVFSALIGAFESRHHVVKEVPLQATVKSSAGADLDEEAKVPVNGSDEKKISKASKTKKASKGSTAEWRMVKDLDLHPPGKKSFEEFILDKQPISNEDKYAVVVYYLSVILEVQAVTIHQIGTMFRLTKTWKEPTALASGLRAAASRKGTIDTKSYEDIKITPAGRNFVEHDLPPKSKGAK